MDYDKAIDLYLYLYQVYHFDVHVLSVIVVSKRQFESVELLSRQLDLLHLQVRFTVS